MKLHHDIKLFSNTLRAASQHLDIKLEFVEKDYWITWQTTSVSESPLVTNFSTIWNQVKEKYHTELSAFAYRPIPDEKDVAKYFEELIKRIE